MKAIRIPITISFILMAVFTGESVLCQGLINSNFESPVLPLTPDAFGTVPIANAMPGWSAYTYGISQSRIAYNNLSLGAAAISLQGPGSSQILEGNYSVILQGSSASTPSSAAIGQIGQVPAMTQSLIFWGGFFGEVTFAGQPVQYSAIGSGPNYTIYGANISSFANQTGEFLFKVLPNNLGILDNIQFSNQPIPEPSIFGLLGFGALLLSWRFVRAHR